MEIRCTQKVMAEMGFKKGLQEGHQRCSGRLNCLCGTAKENGQSRQMTEGGGGEGRWKTGGWEYIRS